MLRSELMTFLEVCPRYIHLQGVRDPRCGDDGSRDRSGDRFLPFCPSLQGAWADLRPYCPTRYFAKCITL